jgi:histidinol-phosphate aminotransferase
MAAFQVPDYIQFLAPYVPGKPIEETQREFNLKRVVKLASNENPLGCSPKAVRAIQIALKEVARYPDSNAYHLKKALSELHKVSTSSLILGNGSNEVIEFLIRTYCVPGDSIVTSQAAFIAYRISAQIHGVSTVEASLNLAMQPDLTEMLELIKRHERVKLVFIANPNNPTGIYIADRELRNFLKEVAKVRGGTVMVVLDYAYWEFVGARDLSDPLILLRDFPNTVVLRTFSKVHGLAGLRIGYGMGAPEIISNMEKVRQPFNMNSIGLAAATASLGDVAFARKCKRLNDQGMNYWEKELNRLAIPFWKSQGNFILVDVNQGLGKSGHDVYMGCLKRGVIFRPVTNYGLRHALRISVGTPAENRLGVAALRAEAKGSAPKRKKKK